METQAGTYVKEFVHGDFGRTRPSLADLLGVSSGEVDILELDVEGVDMEWPPKWNDNVVNASSRHLCTFVEFLCLINF